jgi:hypothetical protein
MSPAAIPPCRKLHTLPPLIVPLLPEGRRLAGGLVAVERR